MNELILEMQEYYRRRATEYDDWYLRRHSYDKGPRLNALWAQDLNHLQQYALSIQGHSILELSCGTGMWTQHLSTNNYILPTDFSPEMLKIMEKRTGVRGELLDNYNLQLKRPEQYDMCFFAFWLSHVPDSFVTDFIGSILRTFKSGTRLLVFDSYLNNTELNCLEHKGNIQIRALKSGDVYRVYKKYFTRDELEDLASACCTSHRIEFTQNYFYILDGNL